MKDEVIKLRNTQPHISASEIARKVGLSRQRVHQILKKYLTIPSRIKKKIKVYLAIDICQEHSIKEKTELHHIDGNNFNNHWTNLMPLCKKAHTKIHIENDLKKAIELYGTCRECHRPFSGKLRPCRFQLNLCKKCKIYFDMRKFQGTKKTYLRQHEKLDKCVRCDRSFKEVKFEASNLCSGCWGYYLYNNSEKRRKLHTIYQKRWREKKLAIDKQIPIVV